MKMIAPNIARPIRKPSDEATRNTLERNSFSGMIGSAARRSTSTKAIRSTTETSASPRIVPEPQRYSLPPQVVTRTSALTPAVSSAGAEPVDLVAVRRGVQMQSGDHDHDRDQPERDVHVEHPAPRDRLDQEAAEQRSGDRGDREHGADQAHVAAAIARRHDVGDDRLRADHQPARAHALQRAEGDQLSHRLAQPGQQRADQEDQDRGQEHRLAAVHVAELSVQRRRRRRGQQVGRDDPGQVLETAEVADDRRQRGGDDRLVERGQEHAEHQRGEDRHERAVVSRPQPPAAACGRRCRAMACRRGLRRAAARRTRAPSTAGAARGRTRRPPGRARAARSADRAGRGCGASGAARPARSAPRRRATRRTGAAARRSRCPRRAGRRPAPARRPRPPARGSPARAPRAWGSGGRAWRGRPRRRRPRRPCRRSGFSASNRAATSTMRWTLRAASARSTRPP